MIKKTLLKKRVIDLEIRQILTKPVIKAITTKGGECYFKALVSYPSAKTDFSKKGLKRFGALMMIDIIAPPYSLGLWLPIWQTHKRERKTFLEGVKVWGFPYKPRRDNVAFYSLEATERQDLSASLKPTGDKEKDHYSQLITALSGNDIGIEYLKGKYPELAKADRTKDYNILTAYFNTPNPGKNCKLLTTADPWEEIKMANRLNLQGITNPNGKEALKDKPLYYQLVDTIADRLEEADPSIDRGEAIKTILAKSSYSVEPGELYRKWIEAKAKNRKQEGN